MWLLTENIEIFFQIYEILENFKKFYSIFKETLANISWNREWENFHEIFGKT